MLERYNQEIKRRTHIVRVFPDGESCLRLIHVLAVETHEDWLEANRYINMQLLEEHKRELIKQAALRRLGMAGAAILDVYAPTMPGTTLGNRVKANCRRLWT